MQPITSIEFMELTAKVAATNNVVKHITKEDNYCLGVGLVTAKIAEILFGDLETERVFNIYEFDKASKDAVTDLLPLFKEIGMTTYITAFCLAEYFTDIENELFDFDERIEFVDNIHIKLNKRFLNKLYGYCQDTESTDEDDYDDFEDDVDETFYNPYTGSEEFEGSEDFGDA